MLLFLSLSQRYLLDQIIQAREHPHPADRSRQVTYLAKNPVPQVLNHVMQIPVLIPSRKGTDAIRALSWKSSHSVCILPPREQNVHDPHQNKKRTGHVYPPASNKEDTIVNRLIRFKINSLLKTKKC